MNKINPVLVYCNLKDVTISSDGEIYIIISKDRKSTVEESVKRLRLLKDKDCSIIFSEMLK